jgi:hypothetical protein
VFQANTGQLFAYSSTKGEWANTALGMAAGTSPSIAAGSGGGWEVAFRANTGQLFTYSSTRGEWANTGLGVASGTSPSIAE